METVSSRAKNYKQPYGGFIKPSQMKLIQLNDNIKLKENENIVPSLVGLVVDYMTRFLDGDESEAFKISLMGASLLGESKKAENLLKEINGLNDESIINACKLVGYDVVYRVGPFGYKPVEEINPDEDTIFNIKVMIQRSLDFLKEYGPVVASGITFEGAYTQTVVNGDADFMTEDTIWDFKVTKTNIKNWHILQVLMYYVLGCRTNSLNTKYDFKNKIKKIGLYNPRLNNVYLLDIKKINPAIIKIVENDVIGYSNNNDQIVKETENKAKNSRNKKPSTNTFLKILSAILKKL